MSTLDYQIVLKLISFAKWFTLAKIQFGKGSKNFFLQ